MKHKVLCLLLAGAMLLSLSACGAAAETAEQTISAVEAAPEATKSEPEAIETAPEAAESAPETAQVSEEAAPAEAESEPAVPLEATGVGDDYFSDRDFEVGYGDHVTITLSDGGSRADGEGVSIDGATVKITQEGVYKLTGTLTKGQIQVELPDTDKAQLVLDNVSVSNQGDAALYILEADKVFLTTAANSENSFETTGEFSVPEESGVDSAVFSKADVTMNGKGTLNVSCETGHGIVSKDDLKITSGTYAVTSGGKALAGKDSVRIADGVISLVSGGDGICSDNDEDPARGYVYIADGNITIDAGRDGIDAHTTLTVKGGTFDITTGGGYENAPAKADDNWGWYQDTAEAETETVSLKGLKADSEVLVLDGILNINSADDAIHSNGNVTVSGGALTISSGDDGVHADRITAISECNLDVQQSYEGIEGALIQIFSGDIRVNSTDDGVNAAGGADGSGLYDWFAGEGEETASVTEEFDISAGSGIEISGGNLYVASEGDGLDTNSTLTITGGDIRVDGPVSSGNGYFDFETGPAEIHSGTIVAVGPTSFSENFHSSSTQGSILQTLTAYHTAGTAVTLTDTAGNVIVSYTPEKNFQSVVISTPDIKVGETYTLTVGDESYTIEMTSLLYGTGGGFGGKGGKGGKSRS